MLEQAQETTTTVRKDELHPWERRLLEKARVLRAGQKSAMMLVAFEGPAMNIYVMTPAGRVLISE